MTSTPKFRRAVAWIAAAACVACLGVNAASAVRYGITSMGDPKHGALTDVVGLSQGRIVSSLESMQRTRRPGVTLSDAIFAPIAKLEQAYTRPTPLLFFGFDSAYQSTDDSRGPLGDFSLGSAAYRKALGALIERHSDLYRLTAFPGPSGERYDSFVLDDRIPAALANPAGAWLLKSPNPTLFNTRNAPLSYGVARVPWQSVNDFLVLVPSVRASSGIVDRPPREEPSTMVSRYELDPLVRGGKIEAVGRYLLFAIVNPSTKVRLVMDFTATLNADGSNRIPPISVLGTQRSALAVAGRGAGRFVSAPLLPRTIGGLPMVAVDMGANGTVFPHARHGLLALFGAQYRLDPRRFVGFVRDISIVSEDEYQRWRTPSAIAEFPADVRYRDLEFSGIYEDGWTAERAVAWLAAPRGKHGSFVVRGSLPALDGLTDSTIHVKIDGSEVASQPVLAGEFEVRADARADGRRHKIELVFDRSFRLPKGDGRVASARLSYVGYE